MAKQRESVTTRRLLEEDRQAEQSLRPTAWGEYVGQDAVKENLRIFIEAARGRKDALDHVLLYGPPGMGKTTLAYIIASELGVSIRPTAAPVIDRPKDLAAILSSLRERDVLFIDEIHRLQAAVEETLYPVMEDYRLDLVIGQGPTAQAYKLQLPKFTLIGATTRAGLLTSPLRDRFGVVQRLDFYSSDDLFRIVQRSAAILGVKITEGGAREMARRSRGTPRVANRLLSRVRDFAQVLGDGVVDEAAAARHLARLEVDEHGFDAMDRRILDTLIRKFNGGPVGIETLAVAVSEERDTVEDVYEPFLIQAGFLARTPRGRTATALAYAHLKLPPPASPQGDLFGR